SSRSASTPPIRTTTARSTPRSSRAAQAARSRASSNSVCSGAARRDRRSAATRYQMFRLASPAFENAIAIQALALADSATRSAGQAALSLRPPALMYCLATWPMARQLAASSNFIRRSRTSARQRFTASLSSWATDSSRESPDEHPDVNDPSNKRSAAALLPCLIVVLLEFRGGAGPRTVHRLGFAGVPPNRAGRC